MIKKMLLVALLFLLIPLVAFVAGCGSSGSSSETATTTTTIATTSTTSTTTTTIVVSAASGVTVKGTTSSGVSGLSIMGVRAMAALTGATVTISKPTTGTDEVTLIATGTTDADGSYSIIVATSELASIKSDSGLATNLMITISKEGTVIGCVIPSLSPEAGATGYSPTATAGDYKKQLIARSAFKKGSDPKNFDYSSDVDRKFSSDTVKDYDATKINDMADSIKSGEDAETEIAAGLGISVANLALMRQKGFELHRTYIEPIMQTAFNTKTPPNRAQMDAAFASMEAIMSEYARSLGLSDQQISDMKSMKDKQIETKMGESADLRGDPSFGEAKRRMAGDKMVNMFLGQWEAANTLATTAPSGKITFAVSHEAAYNSFYASKESIKTQLLALQASAGTSPEAIPNYLRTSFFDAFVFPPADVKPEPPAPGDSPAVIASKEALMRSFMSDYASSRIFMYFVQEYLTTEASRSTFFNTVQPAMQTIFQNRFSNPGASYYMGPDFWASRPTPDAIQAKLTAFNTALTDAVDNNTTARALMISAGFTNDQTTTILKSFRILMAPPDAM